MCPFPESGDEALEAAEAAMEEVGDIDAETRAPAVSDRLGLRGQVHPPLAFIQQRQHHLEFA